MFKASLTAEQVRTLLHYAPDTGALTWRMARNNKTPAGSRAGCVASDGYRVVSIAGTPYAEHRVAWLHFFGLWPVAFLDHINGDRADNRIANLREASRIQNNRNRRGTGALGKGIHINGRGYGARIGVDGGRIHIGTYDTVEEARAAYAEAAVKYHGDFARLK